MAIRDNKPMVILIVVNIISLAVIFWLLWMVMGHDNDTRDSFSSGTHQAPAMYGEAAQDAAITRNQQRVQTASDDEAYDVQDHAALAELSSGDPTSSANQNHRTASAINKFKRAIEDEVLSKQAQDNAQNSGSNFFNNSQNLSTADAQYLAEYEQMKAAEQGAQPRTPLSAEQAKTPGMKRGENAKSVNYFNKVDVSAAPATGQPATAQQLLAQQIRATVKSGATAVAGDSSQNAPASLKTSDKSYIALLQTASAERINEMRLIRVRRGDTLWKISTRAYGTGFKYPRIFKANPHLVSPNDITAGEFLRVPL